MRHLSWIFLTIYIFYQFKWMQQKHFVVLVSEIVHAVLFYHKLYATISLIKYLVIVLFVCTLIWWFVNTNVITLITTRHSHTLKQCIRVDQGVRQAYALLDVICRFPVATKIVMDLVTRPDEHGFTHITANVLLSNNGVQKIHNQVVIWSNRLSQTVAIYEHELMLDPG